MHGLISRIGRMIAGGSSPTRAPLLCVVPPFMTFPVISANFHMNKVIEDQTKTLKKEEKLFKGN